MVRLRLGPLPTSGGDSPGDDGSTPKTNTGGDPSDKPKGPSLDQINKPKDNTSGGGSPPNTGDSPSQLQPPCKPMALPLNFEWLDFKATPKNTFDAAFQIQKACFGWQPCNTSIQITINSPWPKKDGFTKSGKWDNQIPYNVMFERANWIHGIIRSNPKTKDANILAPFIQFDMKGKKQNAIIKFR